MNQAFEFYGIGRVIFGRGTFVRAGEVAAGLGKRALVIYNGGSAEPLVESLVSAGMNATALRQKGEPVVSDIVAAVDWARHGHCDCVVGFGGGSAIDAAKASAAILANGGSIVDYMEVVGKGQKITRPAIPWMAIPTTAGTGAEATRNAVVGFPEKKFKASIRSELLLPRVALIDPELTISVPATVTASCGMDALCQLIESYTSTGATPISDALALRGIDLAAEYLPRAFADGKDLDAREAMSLAALLSGMTLTSAGLGAVHGFAAPVGAHYVIPHGTVCAALLPKVIAANIATLRQSNPADGGRGLKGYADIGRRLPGFSPGSDDQAIDTCVEFTEMLVARLQIGPLRTFGMTQAGIPNLVAAARRASSMKFNPCVLSDDTLNYVLKAAIG